MFVVAIRDVIEHTKVVFFLFTSTFFLLYEHVCRCVKDQEEKNAGYVIVVRRR